MLTTTEQRAALEAAGWGPTAPISHHYERWERGNSLAELYPRAPLIRFSGTPDDFTKFAAILTPALSAEAELRALADRWRTSGHLSLVVRMTRREDADALEAILDRYTQPGEVGG